jgi:hypothetical protein
MRKHIKVAFSFFSVLFVALVVSMSTGSTVSIAKAASKASTPSVITGIPIPGKISATSKDYVTSIAVKQIKTKSWIGIEEHLKKIKIAPSQCAWYAKFYNSDYVLGETSHMPQMYIDHHGYLCRDSASPSGYVKRGGGATGRDCWNISAPTRAQMPHYKFVAPPAEEISNASKGSIKVVVTAHARAEVQLWCGEAAGSGVASDKVKVNFAAFERANSTQAKLSLFLTVTVEAADSANAKASVSCKYTPSPTPAPTPTPSPTPAPTPTPTCQDTSALNYNQPLPCRYPTPSPTAPTANLSYPVINQISVNNGGTGTSNCESITISNTEQVTLTVSAHYAQIASCDPTTNDPTTPFTRTWETTVAPSSGTTYYVEFLEGDDSSQPTSDYASETAVDDDSSDTAYFGSTLASGTTQPWDIQYNNPPESDKQ